MQTAELPKAEAEIRQFNIVKERQIAAPIEVVFDTILHPPGRFAEMSLKLEQWPGGRWYRDLGNNTGHFWGHVQVIKPPTLLEIYGPMFMSYAVASHLQYRLSKQDGGTLMTLTHSAFGIIPPEHLEGVNKGWGELTEQIKAVAEKAAGKR
jgi:uncharacterized protein YndB with AHSA1/START domain